MKTIIVGCRSGFSFGDFISGLLQVDWIVTEVVTGGVRGVDRLAEKWAECQALPLKVFSSEVTYFDGSVGVRRDLGMLSYGEAVVAFWDGQVGEIKHVILEGRKSGLDVVVFRRNAHDCIVISERYRGGATLGLEDEPLSKTG